MEKSWTERSGIGDPGSEGIDWEDGWIGGGGSTIGGTDWIKDTIV